MSEDEGRMLKNFATCLAYPVNPVEGEVVGGVVLEQSSN